MRNSKVGAILEGLHSDTTVSSAVNESKQVISGDKVYDFFRGASKGSEITLEKPLYIGNVAFMTEEEEYRTMANVATKKGWVDKRGEVTIPAGIKGKVVGWDKFTGPIIDFEGLTLGEYMGDWPDISIQVANKKKAKADKKELEILLTLTDALNEELKTKIYTMNKSQRNVVYVMSKGYHTREKITEGYNATLDQGFFSSTFNSSDTANTFMKDLEAVLGKKGKFYFERVELNNGNAVQVPGWGFGVRGVITENRLFKQ